MDRNDCFLAPVVVSIKLLIRGRGTGFRSVIAPEPEAAELEINSLAGGQDSENSHGEYSTGREAEQ